MLAPDQPGSSAEHRQVRQLHGWPVLDRDVATTAGTCRSRFACLDMHTQRLISDVIDGEHVHFGESDQQLAHARRVQLHRGSPELDRRREPSSSQSPCLAPGMPYTPLISEAPDIRV
jgi:hypothetical protein